MGRMICRLTQSGGGFDLPVVGQPDLARRWANSELSAGFFETATNADLIARGYAEIVVAPVPEQTHTSGETVDVWVSGRVSRTPTLQLRPDADLIALRLIDLEAQRDMVIAGPIGFTIGENTYPMSMSLTSQFRTKSAADDGEDEVWVFSDGSAVAVSAAQLVAMKDAIKGHTRSAFATYVAHKAALSGKTGQAILDHDITTGWPAVYQP